MSLELPASVTTPARLEAVRRSGLMNPEPDATFDGLTGLVAQTLGTPMAFVTVVDHVTSLWKSTHGVPEAMPRSAPAVEGFCQYVIDRPAVLMIDDAATHPVSTGNPAIEKMGLRAWAGAPILSPDGEVLGSICGVDMQPRQWTDADAETIRVLAAVASEHVALRATLQAMEALLLPPLLPTLGGVELARAHRPAPDVRLNTFYDAFAVDEQRSFLMLGEILGPRDQPGEIAGLARFSARTAAGWAHGPGELLTLVDDTLHQQAPPDSACAMAAVHLSRQADGSVAATMSAAGHAWVLHQGARQAWVGDGSPPLGPRSGTAIVEHHVRLRPGDALALVVAGGAPRPAPATLSPGSDPHLTAVAHHLLDACVGADGATMILMRAT